MTRSAALLARTTAVTTALAAGMLGATVLAPAAAHADITRCVGAVQTPGAYACYTSPRFDHIGLDRASVATVPVFCYAIGCTGSQLVLFEPGDNVGGRFTSVTYIGNTYTVYRPTDAKPFVVTSNSSTFQPAEDVQQLLIAVALDASGQ